MTTADGITMAGFEFYAPDQEQRSLMQGRPLTETLVSQMFAVGGVLFPELADEEAWMRRLLPGGRSVEVGSMRGYESVVKEPQHDLQSYQLILIAGSLQAEEHEYIVSITYTYTAKTAAYNETIPAMFKRTFSFEMPVEYRRGDRDGPKNQLFVHLFGDRRPSYLPPGWTLKSTKSDLAAPDHTAALGYDYSCGSGDATAGFGFQPLMYDQWSQVGFATKVEQQRKLWAKRGMEFTETTVGDAPALLSRDTHPELSKKRYLSWWDEDTSYGLSADDACGVSLEELIRIAASVRHTQEPIYRALRPDIKAPYLVP